MTERPNDKVVEVVRCKEPHLVRGFGPYGTCKRKAAKDGYCWQHHPDVVRERYRRHTAVDLLPLDAMEQER